jgi:hypothetical protein
MEELLSLGAIWPGAVVSVAICEAGATLANRGGGGGAVGIGGGGGGVFIWWWRRRQRRRLRKLHRNCYQAGIEVNPADPRWRVELDQVALQAVQTCKDKIITRASSQTRAEMALKGASSAKRVVNVTADDA